MLFRVGILHPLVIGSFLLWLVVSQRIAPDYGVTWDEYAQRHHGLVAVDAIHEAMGHALGEERRTTYDLADYPFRYHGLLFTTVAVLLEETLGLTEYHDIYVLRHRMTALLFWIAGLFFYRMLWPRFGAWPLALLGVVMLVLSPRLFADSFNNPKDMVFMPLYMISGFTLVRFLERPSAGRGLAHGLAMSLALSSRLLGLILPAMTLVVIVLLGWVRLRRGKRVRMLLRSSAICASSFLIFSYFWWPAVWGDVLAGLQDISRGAASFEWDKQILFSGQFYEAGEVPWYYLPVWIGLTTPPLYLVLMALGIAVTSFRAGQWIKTGRIPDDNRLTTDITWFALGVLPLIAAILSGAKVYDGWRHLYFTYPFLIALAMTGVSFLMQQSTSRPLLRWALVALLGLSMSATAVFMVKRHPNQQVYFNVLAGRDVHLRYGVDYWGASYRAAYERLAAIDPGTQISVTAANYPGFFNWEALPRNLRERFVFTVNKDEATYYLTNYRGPEEVGALKAGSPPLDRPVHVFSTDCTDYMGIYRLK